MPNVVHQSVTLPASPKRLYSMYLDASQHSAFTAGGRATIAPRLGTEWSAFDGRIHGRVLALSPDRQIVQSWRSFEWLDDDLDSILILSFFPDPAGTRVDLIHAAVPERLHSTLEDGWPRRYWEPWREFLSRRS